MLVIISVRHIHLTCPGLAASIATQPPHPLHVHTAHATAASGMAIVADHYLASVSQLL